MDRLHYPVHGSSDYFVPFEENKRHLSVTLGCDMQGILTTAALWCQCSCS